MIFIMLLDFSLKIDLLQSYPTAMTRLFLNSILIYVSVSIEESGLWCDQVAVLPCLMLSSQQARLQLCTQLLTAVEVGQFLNSPSYCLQVVVMLYGLLTPLLQYGLITKNIAWVGMKSFTYIYHLNCAGVDALLFYSPRSAHFTSVTFTIPSSPHGGGNQL